MKLVTKSEIAMMILQFWGFTALFLYGLLSGMTLQTPAFPLDKNVSLEECRNQGLEETAYCLRNYVNGFYNYTVRPDTKKTFQDIKANGGDCYDYSQLYKSMAEELGFSAQVTAIVPQGSMVGHAIAEIYDDTGYCVMDQALEPYCVDLGDPETRL